MTIISYLFICYVCQRSTRILALVQPGSQQPSRGIEPKNYFKNTYFVNDYDLSPTKILDLVSLSQNGSNDKNTNNAPLRQQLFTSPLISTLYERILPPLWKAGLRIGGPDAEYSSAEAYLTNDNDITVTEQCDGGTGLVTLDLSCGTGFIATRMAKSPLFQYVFGLDYSFQMLNEAVNSVANFERERDTSNTQPVGNKEQLPLCWIRGDAGNLPFRDNVLDAIHWGAAMHCVPDVEKALAETYRVLKPGGKLYATTFLRPFPDIVFRFFTLEEMEDLANEAGFGANPNDKKSSSFLQVEGRGVYGILRAMK